MFGLAIACNFMKGKPSKLRIIKKSTMKSLLMTIVTLSVSTVVFAQGLNSNARYIKENYPTEYEQTLRMHAIQEWNDDYEMIVYMINNQADALFDLIDEFRSDNTNIAFKAIQEWSIDGYESSNIEIFKQINTFGLEQLIPLHCDWEMVKYEYDNQVEAKNSF